MIKSQFPIFTHHPDLVYLDNAATVQKPGVVIDAVTTYLEQEYANIHRGQYQLALISEERRRQARQAVADFLNCPSEEVVFTANSTASVNLLSTSLVRSGRLTKGDLIVVSKLEHHANIVPRQIAAEQTGAEIVYLGRDKDRQYDQEYFFSLPHNRIKIVSLSMVSNVTGQKLDTRFVKKLSTSDALFVLDGSQAAPHMLLDLPRIGGDVVYFTGHKVGALTGIGVLQGRSSLLSSLLPGRSGGGAIQEVTLTGHTYQSLPDKFEAGTPNVVGAVSLHAALERISSLSPSSGSFREQLGRGFEWMQLREKELIDFFSDQMRDLVAAQQVQMVGSLESAARIGLFSFLISPEIGDVQGLGRAFAQQNICIRVGAHCTHPLHTYLPGEQSARVSVRAYNDVEDIRLFFLVLRKYIGIN